MVLGNLNKIISQIELNEWTLDCLEVKLFYIVNRIEKNEFLHNDNLLEQIKLNCQIQKCKTKLHKLNSDFKINFQLLKEAKNETV